jgi:hypothetical protein
MTPEDIESLRRLANRDQANAFFRDYLEAREQHLRDYTPELDDAEDAGRISSAAAERAAIMDRWDIDADEPRTQLINALENASPDAAIDHAQEIFIAGWMAALREHGLLPPEPSYEDRTGEPFPTIEGT